ncbi:hypothetical protein [Bdellovibrio reynosensis]|uniref:DUF2860 domain-containing protein n=1 Tax=Bdellovibrio reynosensis TaxID=2835041 RepID=A0ABY4CA41_9BACT|nr:hypothetical protein [Bdellovibrio reynosensis]UOF01837.1 hypothetical protein MNR06_02575 [Bdellovibrio reynosensis]
MKYLISLALLIFSVSASASVNTSALSASLTSDFSTDKIALSYFGYISSQASDVKEGEASIYSYNLIALGYRLDSRFTAALRPTFTYDSKGLRYGAMMPAQTRWGDSSIDLVDRKPFDFESVRSKAVYRFLLHTDPAWIKENTVGGLGASYEFTKQLSPHFSFGYFPKAFVLVQSKTSYESKPTQLAQLEQWLRLNKYFGDKVSISQGLGLKNMFYNAQTSEQEKRTDFSTLETLVNLDIGDHGTVSLGITQEHPFAKSLQLYKDSESAYVLTTCFWL